MAVSLSPFPEYDVLIGEKRKCDSHEPCQCYRRCIRQPQFCIEKFITEHIHQRCHCSEYAVNKEILWQFHSLPNVSTKIHYAFSGRSCYRIVTFRSMNSFHSGRRLSLVFCLNTRYALSQLMPLLAEEAAHIHRKKV